MKSLMLLGMLLGAYNAHAGFLGADYTCHGTGGEVLTIEEMRTRTVGKAIFAEFKVSDEVKKLFGKRDFTGSYLMSDHEGLPVSLVIKKVYDHGGRCGRCAPSNDVETYAKLTIGQDEYNLNCN